MSNVVSEGWSSTGILQGCAKWRRADPKRLHGNVLSTPLEIQTCKWLSRTRKCWTRHSSRMGRQRSSRKFRQENGNVGHKVNKHIHVRHQKEAITTYVASICPFISFLAIPTSLPAPGRKGTLGTSSMYAVELSRAYHHGFRRRANRGRAS